MWKFLNESVEGTSHRTSGTECQDSSFVTPFRYETDQGLILVCSDGAGSAKESKRGSNLACDTAVQQVMNYLEGGRSIAEATLDDVRGWARVVHATVGAEAERIGLTPRDLACTLLLAVVGSDGTAFAQVGDGGIVVRDGAEYRPVFWPEAGEYQNTTFFVTESGYDQHLQLAVRPQTFAEVSLFSDGLQMLALNYTRKDVHQPFFAPLFSSLRRAADHQELVVPMRQWLDSPAVNQRTDDDKTLVLAARVTADAD